MSELLDLANNCIQDFQHLESYWPKMFNDTKNGGKLTLKIADRVVLEKMDSILSGIEGKLNEIKPTLSPYKSFKRKKREEMAEESDESDQKSIMSYSTSEPTCKKIKASVEELEELFTAFVQRVIGSTNMLVIDTSTDSPQFKVRCEVCEKELCVGYRLTSQGKPSFINTNLIKHPCFKVNKGKILK